LVTGFVEEALKGVDFQLQRRTFVDIARAVDVHIAMRLDQVIGLVVLHAVGLQHHVALAHHGVAFDNGVEIGAAQGMVTREKGGHLLAHGQRNLLLQQGAGLKNQRSVSLFGVQSEWQQGYGDKSHGCKRKAAADTALGFWHQCRHL